jgi:hypothetical protein
MSLFTFPYRSLFPTCSLDFITHVDKKKVNVHISLLIKALMKTKPVLKSKLAGDFDRMPFKS